MQPEQTNNSLDLNNINKNEIIPNTSVHNQAPWHGEGTVMGRLMSTEEAIRKSGADFEVIKCKKKIVLPIFNDDGTQISQEIVDDPINFATVRKDNGQVLGSVGKNYTPLQNIEGFKFFDDIFDEKLAVIDSAGVLRDSKVVWILAKLPGEIRLLGDDITEKYLLFANSHDGSFSLSIKFTPIRISCMNSLVAALRGPSDNSWSIRHTPNINQSVVEAGQVMKDALIYYDEFQAVAEAMTKVKMTDGEVIDYFRKVYKRPKATQIIDKAKDEDSEELEDHESDAYPDDETPEPETKKETKWRALDKLMETYETGPGQEINGVRGTLWGAYNALTRYEDHEKKVRNEDEVGRVRKIWFDNLSLKVKNDAMKIANDIITRSK